jgi:hypothetical protein
MLKRVGISLRANPRNVQSLGARGRRIVQSVMTVTLKLGNHDYVIAKVYEFGGTVT